MKDYIDLVIVKDPESGIDYIFSAPFASGIREGDYVTTEDICGLQSFVVKTVASFSTSSDEYKFIESYCANNEGDFRKITGVVKKIGCNEGDSDV